MRFLLAEKESGFADSFTKAKLVQHLSFRAIAQTRRVCLHCWRDRIALRKRRFARPLRRLPLLSAPSSRPRRRSYNACKLHTVAPTLWACTLAVPASAFPRRCSVALCDRCNSCKHASSATGSACLLSLSRRKPGAQFEARLRRKKGIPHKGVCPFSGGEGETRTLAPGLIRPTPLAGAPRHQLEYFSIPIMWGDCSPILRQLSKLPYYYILKVSNCQ